MLGRGDGLTSSADCVFCRCEVLSECLDQRQQAYGVCLDDCEGEGNQRMSPCWPRKGRDPPADSHCSSSAGIWVAEVEMNVVTILCTASFADEADIGCGGAGCEGGGSTIMVVVWATRAVSSLSRPAQPSKRAQSSHHRPTSTTPPPTHTRTPSEYGALTPKDRKCKPSQAHAGEGTPADGRTPTRFSSS